MLPGESVVDRNRRVFGTARPVAVVTGSTAPRVGRRIAETLLSHGFHLLFHCHRAGDDASGLVAEINRDWRFEPAEESLDASPPRAGLLVGAIEDEERVGGWRDEVLGTYGRVDVLVNSAAQWEPLPLEETRIADFERAFRVNALGTALCCQQFGLAMAAQPSGGAIVNIGDWATSRPYRDFAAYFVSKGSIGTLTRAMAIELAGRNPRVRVNAILPGPVLLADGIDGERQSHLREASLLKRHGTPDDVAQAALFLATQPFITGVCLPVDGGRSIHAGPSSDPIAHPDYTEHQ